MNIDKLKILLVIFSPGSGFSGFFSGSAIDSYSIDIRDIYVPGIGNKIIAWTMFVAPLLKYFVEL